MIDGTKVKQLRNEKGVSLRLLAALVTEQTGRTVSAEALSKVEAGAYDLSIEKTVALAQTLGVGISDILLPLERVSA